MSQEQMNNQGRAVARSALLALTILLVAILVLTAIVPTIAPVTIPGLILLGIALIIVQRRADNAADAAILRAQEEALRDAWSGCSREPVATSRPPRTAEDLAGLIRAEAATLTQRLNALESLVGVVDVAAIGVDASGRVWLANGAATELFGPGLTGRDIEEVFTQPDIVALASAARRGSSRHARIRLSRPSGPVILDVACFPLGAAGPGDAGLQRFGAAMTFLDVTELATAVQLKTDFVANASHELRTPLSAIRASVETIQDAAGDDPEARARFLRTIANATTRLEDLCRDLMDLSRVEASESSVELSEVAMGTLTGELTDHFESACAERSLTLRFEIDPRAAIIRTDPRLLSLILRNLIENSTKFAFERTIIRVLLMPAATAPETRDLIIEVIDQGIGIPIGLQARIFERFFQADPSRTGNGKRGTGLGLAIVKHAVRALGATISVNSVWKQGTTMRVQIPDALLPAGPITSPLTSK